MLGQNGQPILENLAIAPRRLAEAAGRNASGAMEGAHEVGKVGKADIEGDVGDRAIVVGQQARCMAQTRAHQILVRGHADHFREQAQEMERAQFSLARCAAQIDLLVRMFVEPHRRLDRTAAIA